MPSETGASPEAKIAEAEVRPDTLAEGKASELALKDIYFDYDQSAIREDSKKQLNENIEWLRKNPAGKVTIEGHCDERGSSEYNLALGERRARATRDYLTAAGVGANRISTISFGKERPFAPGHDESAWKWNRRAHFTLSAK
jgi:peptidoglycan-associated lipoprotein